MELTLEYGEKVLFDIGSDIKKIKSPGMIDVTYHSDHGMVMHAGESVDFTGKISLKFTANSPFLIHTSSTIQNFRIKSYQKEGVGIPTCTYFLK